jgi:putative ABC transport system permease protein
VLFAGTTRMPTSNEEDAARAAAEDANGYLSVERGYQDHYAIGLLALVVAAGLVTLGGTFTAVGLAAAEGKADVATLAAIGASPGVRRRLAASQAGVIAGLGSILGVGSGVLAGWILVRMQQNSTERLFNDAGPTLPANAWHFVVPWTYLLATGFGVPLLAVLIGFLSTRSRLPLVRRLGQ